MRGDDGQVLAAVESTLAGLPMAVLAVSGGVDSMVLLHGAATVLPRERLLVATYDHRTGAYASRAAAFVVRRALALGIPVVLGRREEPGSASEATLRAGRLQFLREVAERACATRGASAGAGPGGAGRIVTAHTRDDQIETVFMRILRGASARGLAGLRSDTGILRPLLDSSRQEILAYAAANGVRWLEDPSNESRRYLRNRVRHDLLPALNAVAPRLAADLGRIGEAAAEWRAQVDAVAAAIPAALRRVPGGGVTLTLPAAALQGYSSASLGILWPALAAKAGLTLDWRGTARLVQFTISGAPGRRIQLSGGWSVVRSRSDFELVEDGRSCSSLDGSRLDSTDDLCWGEWRFRRIRSARASDLWTAAFPADGKVRVRRWTAGDRLYRPGGAGRSGDKVKRMLTKAGITGWRRVVWPVVLVDDRIVWIPGVRRSDAAADRSGRPARALRCELFDT